MKEYKVGEEIQLGRIKVRVEEAEGCTCNGCIFKKEPEVVCDFIKELTGGCSKDFREDKKDVKYVKVN